MTDIEKLTQQLVQIDSSDPGAYESEMEAFVRLWLEKRIKKMPDSLREKVSLSELEVLPGRRGLMVTLPSREPAVESSRTTDSIGSAWAEVPISTAQREGTRDEHAGNLPSSTSGNGEAAQRLVFICHMDTVTLGDGWSEDIDPLGGLVRDGRLYGRGSCDMKGGLACAMLAFAAMLEQASATGELPPRTLSLICTVDEEDQMRGVEAALSAGWVGAHDWVLDCEPTDAQLQVAHKGRTWFRLTMTGVTAHASQPWKGADAIAAMAEAIRSIRREVEALPEHDELGRPTVTFGQITGGYQPYVVPDSCTVWIDMRLVPPADTPAATAIVERAIAAAETEVPGTHGSFVITGDRPAIERDPNSPLLAAVLAASEHVLGTPAEVGPFTGYTDTAVIAGRTGNHNCMSYGPGSLALAHKPNEYVPLADLARVRAVLTELAQSVIWQRSKQ